MLARRPLYRRLVQVSFVRSERNSCEIVVKRDDGVVLRSVQPLRGSRPPHDLVHFAVEGALELGEGVWGCIAEGAEFKSFEHVSGRRRPHAGERSRAILRRARRQLTTAEVLAGAVERLAQTGWQSDPPRVCREVERQLSTSPRDRRSAASGSRRRARRFANTSAGGLSFLSVTASTPAGRRGESGSISRCEVSSDQPASRAQPSWGSCSLWHRAGSDAAPGHWRWFCSPRTLCRSGSRRRARPPTDIGQSALA